MLRKDGMREEKNRAGEGGTADSSYVGDLPIGWTRYDDIAWCTSDNLYT